MRSAPEQVVSRWFTRDTNGFTLDASIRGSVKFVRHNLAADSFPPGESGFDAADLILCRNVLIYFDLRTVQRVLAQLLDVLSPDGWLLLGASDPPVASLMACEVVVTEAGLAYRRARASDGTPVIDRRPASAAPETDLRGDGPVKWRATPSASLAPEPPEAALVARYGARDFRGAVTAAEYLLREQPASEFAWLALVRSLANLGEFAEAGRTNALAIERCPLSAELTYLAAVIQSHAGQHAQAADSARRALYLDHTLVVAHVALGAALASLGDRKDARRATGNAMRLLEGMDAGDAVPGADGETAGVMLALVRAERRLSGPPDGSADTA